MLHVDPAAAAGLAELIDPYTSGNPYETVELLNALRRDGRAGRDRGRLAVGRRRRCARTWAGSEVAGLLAARVEALPAPSRRVVEAMACLGGRAELSLLQTATGAAGRRGGAGAGARARRGPAGGRARGAGGGAVSPRPHPRGHPGAGWTRSGDAPCSWPWRGGWPRCRSCSRSRPSSTCRWPTRSRIPRSARRVVGLLRRAADQAALIGDYALVNALLARGAAADRPGRDRHAGRGAHRPARRPVQHRAPGGGRRGVPHHRAAVPDRAAARGRDLRAGAQPDPPQPFRGGARARPGLAARARHHRPGRGPAPRRARPPVRRTCTGGWTTPTPPTIWRGRSSPTRRCSPRPG